MPLSIVARPPSPHRPGRIGSHLPAAAVLAAALGLTALVSPVRAAETVTVAEVSVDDAKEVLATVERACVPPQARTRIGGTLTSVAVTEGRRRQEGATSSPSSRIPS